MLKSNKKLVLKLNLYEDNKNEFKINDSHHSLQDFTVLPTEIFCRCVIRSSSVIYLPTSSPTDSVRRLSLSLAISVGKTKNFICRWFYRRNLRAKKKSFPLEIYRRIFIPLVISGFTDGYVPLVKLSVSV